MVEKHFKKPVIVTGYPAAIKAFYMRMNDDGKTVAAMDILAPGIGEIVGGSQREERLEKLESRMKDMHIPAEEMSWYYLAWNHNYYWFLSWTSLKVKGGF